MNMKKTVIDGETTYWTRTPNGAATVTVQKLGRGGVRLIHEGKHHITDSRNARHLAYTLLGGNDNE